HTLLQLLPLTSKPTLADLKQKLQELVASHQLPLALAKNIPLTDILWFFETDLGKEILANPEKVKREQPFSMIKDAREVYLDFDEPGAELLVHGMIDGYIEYADEIVLYDFKTDKINGNSAAFQANYQGQLRLYKKALEEALGKPVTRTFLVALSTNTIFPMFVDELPY
ncbi:MAG: PD-(D/E)XK nuclease family protein, partial [Enterococcus aquimarinus]